MRQCYTLKKKKKKGETISRTKRFVGSNLRSDF